MIRYCLRFNNTKGEPVLVTGVFLEIAHEIRDSQAALGCTDFEIVRDRTPWLFRDKYMRQFFPGWDSSTAVPTRAQVDAFFIAMRRLGGEAA